MKTTLFSNEIRQRHRSYEDVKSIHMDNREVVNLKDGQIIKAKLSSILQKSMILELETGASFETQYDSMLNLELMEGKSYRFIVKVVQDKPIMIKPIIEETAGNLQEEQGIIEFLKKIGTTVDQDKIELVKQLMKNELPVSEKMIYEINKLKFQWDKINDLLEAKGLHIMENRTEISISKLLKEFFNETADKPQAAEQLDSAVDEISMKEKSAIPEKSGGETEKSIGLGQGKVVGQELRNALSTGKLNIQDMNFEKILFLFKNNLTMNLKNATSLNDIVLRNFPISDQLEMIIEQLSQHEDTSEMWQSLAHTGTKIKNGLMGGHLDFQEDLKELYIKSHLIQEKLEHLDMKKTSDIIKQLENLKNNIEFIGKVNQFHTYYQLPIEIGNALKNLEIFICDERKKHKKINLQDLKIFVSLDTKNMDTVQVLIEIKEKNIVCNFRIAGEKVKKSICNSQEKLTEQLINHGFSSVQFNYAISQKPIHLLNVETINPVNKRNFIDVKV